MSQPLSAAHWLVLVLPWLAKSLILHDGAEINLLKQTILFVNMEVLKDY